MAHLRVTLSWQIFTLVTSNNSSSRRPLLTSRHDMLPLPCSSSHGAAHAAPHACTSHGRWPMAHGSLCVMFQVVCVEPMKLGSPARTRTYGALRHDMRSVPVIRFVPPTPPRSMTLQPTYTSETSRPPEIFRGTLIVGNPHGSTDCLESECCRNIAATDVCCTTAPQLALAPTSPLVRNPITETGPYAPAGAVVGSRRSKP